MSDRPVLIVVTGPPASGKTSAARRLAERLTIPFLSKDTFKERLYEIFGSGEEHQAAIEEAALAILYSVTASQLAAGVSVVAESNFDADSDLGDLLALAAEHDAPIVQAHIGGEIEALVAEFARRAAEGTRHPGHRDEPADADELRARLAAGQWRPLELPGALVEADMDDDEDEIVDRVRAACER